jgi:hypothetical protein
MSASSGTVSIRFDVQGNEQLLKTLITAATGMDKMSASTTKLQGSLGSLGVGNLSPLNNIATSVNNMGTGMGAAEAKVSSFKTKLAGIGSALSQNATSFGVATASIWGVYNAYDSLIKVQIRADTASNKVKTLETSLAALIERRRIAMEKGNLTGEQMNILNEKITNTQLKLNTAQERSADVAQDVQEAWAGFFSTIGPQAVAAAGSIAQLANTFKGSFANTGGVFNTLKNAISGLIPSLSGAKGAALLLAPALGGAVSSGTSLKTVAAGLTAGISPLAGGFKSLAGFITPAALSMGAVSTAAPAAGAGLETLGAGAGVASVGLKGLAITAGALLIPIYAVISAIKDIPDLIGFIKNTAIENDPLAPLQDRLEARKKKIEFSLQPISWNIGSWGTALGNLLNPKIKPELEGELVDINKKLATVKGTAEGLAPTTQNIGQGFTFMGDAVTSAVGPTTNFQQAQQAVVDSGKAYNAALLTGDQALIASTKSKWEADKITLQNAKSNQTAATSYFTLGKGIPIADAAQKQYNQTSTGSITIAQLLSKEKAKLWGYTLSETSGEQGLIAARAHGLDMANQEIEGTKKAVAVKNAHKEVLLAYVQALGLTSNAQNLSLEEINLLKDAYAGDSDALEKLSGTILATSGPLAQQISNFLDAKIAAVDYTQALTDSGIANRLIQQGTLTGIQQADQWFQSLVKNTAQEEVFNSSLADGAAELGINADMLAFSSSKMQELITTIYQTGKKFFEMSYAAASNTKAVADLTNNMDLLDAASLTGLKSANDWAIGMAQSVEATASEHDQLLHLTADMLGLPVPLSLTSDQLKKVMTNFKETGDAAGSLANVVTENLAPAFDLITGLLDAKSFKELGKSLKDLELPKGFLKAGKDVDDAMKPMFNAAHNATKAANAIKLLTGLDLKEGDFKKKLDTVKGALEKLQKVPGTIPAIDNILDQAEHMNRTDFIKHAGSLNMIFDAINQYGFLPDDIASAAIKLFDEENARVDPSGGNAAKGLNAVATSAKAASLEMLGFHKVQNQASINGKPTQAFSIEPTIIKKPSEVTEIEQPKPIVFPPPDLRNILTGVSQAEIMMSEMVKYAAGLTIAFPEPTSDNIITGVSKAQMVSGDLVTYIAGLSMAFPEPIIDAVITAVSEAQIAADAVRTYIAGLTDMAFPAPSIVAVANQSSAAKKAIELVKTFISGSSMKLAFQAPNIVAVANQVSAAKKALDTVKTHIEGLELKFPKPNIDQIKQGVKDAQSEIDKLHGKTVENHVKTVFDNAGGNILNDMKITSAAMGKMFTTNGEQLFRVGDNPGGRETIAIIPHDKPHEIMDKLTKMFPPIISTLRERARRPSMQTISGSIGGGGQRSGPTIVNVTTEVYLFPGSAQFKKYIKTIMLEGMSVMPTA